MGGPHGRRQHMWPCWLCNLKAQLGQTGQLAGTATYGNAQHHRPGRPPDRTGVAPRPRQCTSLEWLDETRATKRLAISAHLRHHAANACELFKLSKLEALGQAVRHPCPVFQVVRTDVDVQVAAPSIPAQRGQGQQQCAVLRKASRAQLLSLQASRAIRAMGEFVQGITAAIPCATPSLLLLLNAGGVDADLAPLQGLEAQALLQVGGLRARWRGGG